jgi:hypothetical protein
MIQLSYTFDSHRPVAIRFDESADDNKPQEYHHHFHGYEYLSENEALEKANDEFTTSETKKAILDALND